jgi:hypothetical protein
MTTTVDLERVANLIPSASIASCRKMASLGVPFHDIPARERTGKFKTLVEQFEAITDRKEQREFLAKHGDAIFAAK